MLTHALEHPGRWRGSNCRNFLVGSPVQAPFATLAVICVEPSGIRRHPLVLAGMRHYFAHRVRSVSGANPTVEFRDPKDSGGQPKPQGRRRNRGGSNARSRLCDGARTSDRWNYTHRSVSRACGRSRRTVHCVLSESFVRADCSFVWRLQPRLLVDPLKTERGNPYSWISL